MITTNYITNILTNMTKTNVASWQHFLWYHYQP